MGLTLSDHCVIFHKKGNIMNPDSVTRFSVSMPASLVNRLDEMVNASGFANRSQAVCKLVRNSLVDHDAAADSQEIAGTITLVFDHHKPNLQSLLTSIQHDHHAQIISTLHVHLDHDNCLEVLVVRGRARQVKAMADDLVNAKGVKHGKLTVTTTGKDIHS
jgi:CopG family transcriptional regulator, nickel-responsive regulator